MTIDAYTPERLAVTSGLWPETEGRKENQNYVILDMIAIPKSDRYRSNKLYPPSYRRGWGHLLPKSARFSIMPFTADRKGEQFPAVGVILKEPDEEVFVAWFRAEREAEARHVIAELNREIEEVWRVWDASRDSAARAETGEQPRRWMTFERGAEYAPDSRWGAEVLTLFADGQYAYTRRQRGKLHETKAGAIAPARAAAIFDQLRLSTFPDVPQHKVPPGASLLFLTVGEGAPSSEPVARAQVDRRFGLSLPHYSDVIEWMFDLVEAIRTDDATVLATWQLAP